MAYLFGVEILRSIFCYITRGEKGGEKTKKEKPKKSNLIPENCPFIILAISRAAPCSLLVIKGTFYATSLQLSSSG